MAQRALWNRTDATLRLKETMMELEAGVDSTIKHTRDRVGQLDDLAGRLQRMQTKLRATVPKSVLDRELAKRAVEAQGGVASKLKETHEERQEREDREEEEQEVAWAKLRSGALNLSVQDVVGQEVNRFTLGANNRESENAAEVDERMKSKMQVREQKKERERELERAVTRAAELAKEQAEKAAADGEGDQGPPEVKPEHMQVGKAVDPHAHGVAGEEENDSDLEGPLCYGDEQLLARPTQARFTVLAPKAGAKPTGSADEQMQQQLAPDPEHATRLRVRKRAAALAGQMLAGHSARAKTLKQIATRGAFTSGLGKDSNLMKRLGDEVLESVGQQAVADRLRGWLEDGVPDGPSQAARVRRRKILKEQLGPLDDTPADAADAPPEAATLGQLPPPLPMLSARKPVVETVEGGAGHRQAIKPGSIRKPLGLEGEGGFEARKAAQRAAQRRKLEAQRARREGRKLPPKPRAGAAAAAAAEATEGGSVGLGHGERVRSVSPPVPDLTAPGGQRRMSAAGGSIADSIDSAAEELAAREDSSHGPRAGQAGSVVFVGDDGQMSVPGIVEAPGLSGLGSVAGSALGHRFGPPLADEPGNGLSTQELQRALHGRALTRADSFDAPQAPRELQLVRVAPTSIVISFLPPLFDGGSEVYDYVVNYSAIETKGKGRRKFQVATEQPALSVARYLMAKPLNKDPGAEGRITFAITGLLPGKDYLDITVAARAIFGGEGEPSATLEGPIRTPVAPILPAPERVHVSAITSKTITLEWDAPFAHNNQGISYYEVSYTAHSPLIGHDGKPMSVASKVVKVPGPQADPEATLDEDSDGLTALSGSQTGRSGLGMSVAGDGPTMFSGASQVGPAGSSAHGRRGRGSVASVASGASGLVRSTSRGRRLSRQGSSRRSVSHSSRASRGSRSRRSRSRGGSRPGSRGNEELKPREFHNLSYRELHTTFALGGLQGSAAHTDIMVRAVSAATELPGVWSAPLPEVRTMAPSRRASVENELTRVQAILRARDDYREAHGGQDPAKTPNLIDTRLLTSALQRIDVDEYEQRLQEELSRMRRQAGEAMTEEEARRNESRGARRRREAAERKAANDAANKRALASALPKGLAAELGLLGEPSTPAAAAGRRGSTHLQPGQAHVPFGGADIGGPAVRQRLGSSPLSLDEGMVHLAPQPSEAALWRMEEAAKEAVMEALRRPATADLPGREPEPLAVQSDDEGASREGMQGATAAAASAASPNRRARRASAIAALEMFQQGQAAGEAADSDDRAAARRRLLSFHRSHQRMTGASTGGERRQARARRNMLRGAAAVRRPSRPDSDVSAAMFPDADVATSAADLLPARPSSAPCKPLHSFGDRLRDRLRRRRMEEQAGDYPGAAGVAPMGAFPQAAATVPVPRGAAALALASASDDDEPMTGLYGGFGSGKEEEEEEGTAGEQHDPDRPRPGDAGCGEPRDDDSVTFSVLAGWRAGTPIVSSDEEELPGNKAAKSIRKGLRRTPAEVRKAEDENNKAALATLREAKMKRQQQRNARRRRRSALVKGRSDPVWLSDSQREFLTRQRQYRWRLRRIERELRFQRKKREMHQKALKEIGRRSANDRDRVSRLMAELGRVARIKNQSQVLLSMVPTGAPQEFKASKLVETLAEEAVILQTMLLGKQRKAWRELSGARNAVDTIARLESEKRTKRGILLRMNTEMRRFIALQKAARRSDFGRQSGQGTALIQQAMQNSLKGALAVGGEATGGLLGGRGIVSRADALALPAGVQSRLLRVTFEALKVSGAAATQRKQLLRKTIMRMFRARLMAGWRRWRAVMAETRADWWSKGGGYQPGGQEAVDELKAKVAARAIQEQDDPDAMLALTAGGQVAPVDGVSGAIVAAGGGGIGAVKALRAEREAAVAAGDSFTGAESVAGVSVLGQQLQQPEPGMGTIALEKSEHGRRGVASRVAEVLQNMARKSNEQQVGEGDEKYRGGADGKTSATQWKILEVEFRNLQMERERRVERMRSAAAGAPTLGGKEGDNDNDDVAAALKRGPQLYPPAGIIDNVFVDELRVADDRVGRGRQENTLALLFYSTPLPDVRAPPLATFQGQEGASKRPTGLQAAVEVWDMAFEHPLAARASADVPAGKALVPYNDPAMLAMATAALRAKEREVGGDFAPGMPSYDHIIAQALWRQGRFDMAEEPYRRLSVLSGATCDLLVQERDRTVRRLILLRRRMAVHAVKRKVAQQRQEAEQALQLKAAEAEERQKRRQTGTSGLVGLGSTRDLLLEAKRELEEEQKAQREAEGTALVPLPDDYGSLTAAHGPTASTNAAVAVSATRLSSVSVESETEAALRDRLKQVTQCLVEEDERRCALQMRVSECMDRGGASMVGEDGYKRLYIRERGAGRLDWAAIACERLAWLYWRRDMLAQAAEWGGRALSLWSDVRVRLRRRTLKRAKRLDEAAERKRLARRKQDRARLEDAGDSGPDLASDDEAKGEDSGASDSDEAAEVGVRSRGGLTAAELKAAGLQARVVYQENRLPSDMQTRHANEAMSRVLRELTVLHLLRADTARAEQSRAMRFELGLAAREQTGAYQGSDSDSSDSEGPGALDSALFMAPDPNKTERSTPHGNGGHATHRSALVEGAEVKAAAAATKSDTSLDFRVKAALGALGVWKTRLQFAVATVMRPLKLEVVGATVPALRSRVKAARRAIADTRSGRRAMQKRRRELGEATDEDKATMKILETTTATHVDVPVMDARAGGALRSGTMQRMTIALARTTILKRIKVWEEERGELERRVRVSGVRIRNLQDTLRDLESELTTSTGALATAALSRRPMRFAVFFVGNKESDNAMGRGRVYGQRRPDGVREVPCPRCGKGVLIGGGRGRDPGRPDPRNTTGSKPRGGMTSISRNKKQGGGRGGGDAVVSGAAGGSQAHALRATLGATRAAGRKARRGSDAAEPDLRPDAGVDAGEDTFNMYTGGGASSVGRNALGRDAERVYDDDEDQESQAREGKEPGSVICWNCHYAVGGQAMGLLPYMACLRGDEISVHRMYGSKLESRVLVAEELVAGGEDDGSGAPTTRRGGGFVSSRVGEKRTMADFANINFMNEDGSDGEDEGGAELAFKKRRARGPVVGPVMTKCVKIIPVDLKTRSQRALKMDLTGQTGGGLEKTSAAHLQALVNAVKVGNMSLVRRLTQSDAVKQADKSDDEAGDSDDGKKKGEKQKKPGLVLARGESMGAAADTVAEFRRRKAELAAQHKSASRSRQQRAEERKRLHMQRLQRGHSRTVTCLEITDTRLFTGSADCTIRAWDWRHGTCVGEFIGHTGSIASLRVDVKRVLLASGGTDRTARLWDTRKYTCLRVIRKHDATVTQVRLWHDLWVTASQDGVIGVWDLRGLQPDEHVVTGAELEDLEREQSGKEGEWAELQRKAENDEIELLPADYSEEDPDWTSASDSDDMDSDLPSSDESSESSSEEEDSDEEDTDEEGAAEGGGGGGGDDESTSSEDEDEEDSDETDSSDEEGELSKKKQLDPRRLLHEEDDAKLREQLAIRANALRSKAMLGGVLDSDDELDQLPVDEARRVRLKRERKQLLKFLKARGRKPTRKGFRLLFDNKGRIQGAGYSRFTLARAYIARKRRMLRDDPDRIAKERALAIKIGRDTVSKASAKDKAAADPESQETLVGLMWNLRGNLKERKAALAQYETIRAELRKRRRRVYETGRMERAKRRAKDRVLTQLHYERQQARRALERARRRALSQKTGALAAGDGVLRITSDSRGLDVDIERADTRRVAESQQRHNMLLDVHTAPVTSIGLATPLLVSGDMIGVVVMWDLYRGVPLRLLDTQPGRPLPKGISFPNPVVLRGSDGKPGQGGLHHPAHGRGGVQGAGSDEEGPGSREPEEVRQARIVEEAMYASAYTRLPPLLHPKLQEEAKQKELKLPPPGRGMSGPTGAHADQLAIESVLRAPMPLKGRAAREAEAAAGVAKTIGGEQAMLALTDGAAAAGAGGSPGSPQQRGQPERRFPVAALEVSTRRIVAGLQDGQVMIYHGQTGDRMATLFPRDAMSTPVAGAGSSAASTLAGLVQLGSGQTSGPATLKAGQLRLLTLTFDTRRILAAFDDGVVRRWWMPSDDGDKLIKPL